MSTSSTTECSRLRCVDRVRVRSGTRGRGPARRLFGNAMLLQPAIERAAAQAELLRGEPNVPAVTRQHLLDEETLGVFERERLGVGIARATPGAGDAAP